MWRLFREFLAFLREEKKWWMLPLVLMLLLLAVLVLFSSSPVAPVTRSMSSGTPSTTKGLPLPGRRTPTNAPSGP